MSEGMTPSNSSPGFVTRHPEVELNLDSSIDLVDFADGRFDAALRYGTGEWGGLVGESLLEEWLAPGASPSAERRSSSSWKESSR